MPTLRTRPGRANYGKTISTAKSETTNVANTRNSNNGLAVRRKTEEADVNAEAVLDSQEEDDEEQQEEMEESGMISLRKRINPMPEIEIDEDVALGVERLRRKWDKEDAEDELLEEEERTIEVQKRGPPDIETEQTIVVGGYRDLDEGDMMNDMNSASYSSLNSAPISSLDSSATKRRKLGAVTSRRRSFGSVERDADAHMDLLRVNASGVGTAKRRKSSSVLSNGSSSRRNSHRDNLKEREREREREKIVARSRRGSTRIRTGGVSGDMDMENEDPESGDTITVSMESSLPSPPTEEEDEGGDENGDENANLEPEKLVAADADESSSIEVDTGNNVKLVVDEIGDLQKGEDDVAVVDNDNRKGKGKGKGNGKGRGKKEISNGKGTSKEHSTTSTHKERNVDEVVFGDICFKAWYSSWYPRDNAGAGVTSALTQIHNSSSIPHIGSQIDASASQISEANGNGNSNSNSTGNSSSQSQETGAKDTRSKDPKAQQNQIDRLFVCNWCFAYSTDGGKMRRHRECCERRVGSPPGRLVYVHQGRRGRERNGAEGVMDANAKGGEVVDGDDHEVEGWSVWEVDGEREVTFSQSLSLFAKLFLDNKSVFFDVASFNYFLLVHTSRTPTSTPAHSQSTPTQTTTLQHQTVAFFSKEKMSWDNNNLACILVFPPWQKKGLGNLLMGVSYEIARKEGIYGGGPEKPISVLGGRAYRRFWGGEVARWILGWEGGSGEEDEGIDGVGERNGGDGGNNGVGTGAGAGGVPQMQVFVAGGASASASASGGEVTQKKSGKGMGKGWRKGMKGVGMNGLKGKMKPTTLVTVTTSARGGGEVVGTKEMEKVREGLNGVERTNGAEKSNGVGLASSSGVGGTCTVGEISKGTWIAIEDCLGVLRGMDVAVGEGGVGGGGKGGGKGNIRVKIDKQRVREWVVREGISLEKCVREEGFVCGFGDGDGEGDVGVGGIGRARGCGKGGAGEEGKVEGDEDGDREEGAESEGGSEGVGGERDEEEESENSVDELA